MAKKHKYDPSIIDSIMDEVFLVRRLHYLEDRYNRIAKSCLDGDSYADSTYAGIEAMHAKIRVIGWGHVSALAPNDWAWRLVGILGCGYSGLTNERVISALTLEGWHN